MSHIVESCPLTKLNGGLSRLHSGRCFVANQLWFLTHTRRRRRLGLLMFLHPQAMLQRRHNVFMSRSPDVCPVVPAKIGLSAGRAGRASSLQTYCCRGIRWPRAVFSCLVCYVCDELSVTTWPCYEFTVSRRQSVCLQQCLSVMMTIPFTSELC